MFIPQAWGETQTPINESLKVTLTRHDKNQWSTSDDRVFFGVHLRTSTNMFLKRLYSAANYNYTDLVGERWVWWRW